MRWRTLGAGLIAIIFYGVGSLVLIFGFATKAAELHVPWTPVTSSAAILVAMGASLYVARFVADAMLRSYKGSGVFAGMAVYVAAASLLSLANGTFGGLRGVIQAFGALAITYELFVRRGLQRR